MTISVCDLSMPVRVIAAVYVSSHFARDGSQHSSWIAVALHVGMHQIRGSVAWTLGFRISVGVNSNTDPPFLLLGLLDFAFPWVLIATLISFLRVPQIVEPTKHGSLHKILPGCTS